MPASEGGLESKTNQRLWVYKAFGKILINFCRQLISLFKFAQGNLVEQYS
jgi:hypothetical protein